MRKNAKEAIVEAAISLFNTKGFNGTSIRDIASKANVNIANIAYYFQNKNGLLEYCLTTFYESYIKAIEDGISFLDKGATFTLHRIVENILVYQCDHLQLTRFILREMSLDSQIVREIMSTYFVKERYYLRKVFEHGMQTGEFKKLSINYVILQLKSLLSMPFLNAQYMTEVLYIFPSERYFVDKYLQELQDWFEQINQVQNQSILI
ncbi:forespore capture DNA-binding protein RefZ [Cytobacillus spongiae]|uniref:forespore capture DNA-binding protein RefZ n=1 Tax=Cytobacillus spongiae TaxID=2901381 RepID=UPI001F444515|nr:forespore capture DNA-binding protein RefZ [Cytobacillus spongiae]UII55193.1 forespore capture DNA-binding protein RefZ [Cytobacillus spongiae]